MNKNLRKQMKVQRRLLDDEFRDIAAAEIAYQLGTLPGMNRAMRIGVYMAFGGEVDCQPFIESAKLRKKRIFLPVLAKTKLLFAPYKSDSKMVVNQYAILEPVYKRREIIVARDLDAVIVPLVAFDSDCNRLGMGGGFYDRCFAFRSRRLKWRKPLLIGVAYDFQRVNSFRTETWDVPLDAVVTEKECYGSC
jgi:5-formyltetrahydrofolate cyclo-ligase